MLSRESSVVLSLWHQWHWLTELVVCDGVWVVAGAYQRVATQRSGSQRVDPWLCKLVLLFAVPSHTSQVGAEQCEVHHPHRNQGSGVKH